MLVLGVLTLYTSDPTSAGMQAWVARMKQTGRLVFLRPLTQLKPRKRRVEATVDAQLRASLSALPIN